MLSLRTNIKFYHIYLHTTYLVLKFLMNISYSRFHNKWLSIIRCTTRFLLEVLFKNMVLSIFLFFLGKKNLYKVHTCSHNDEFYPWFRGETRWNRDNTDFGIYRYKYSQKHFIMLIWNAAETIYQFSLYTFSSE